MSDTVNNSSLEENIKRKILASIVALEAQETQQLLALESAMTQKTLKSLSESQGTLQEDYSTIELAYDKSVDLHNKAVRSKLELLESLKPYF